MSESSSAWSLEDQKRSDRKLYLSCCGPALLIAFVFSWGLHQYFMVPVVHHLDDEGRVILEYSVRRGLKPILPVRGNRIPDHAGERFRGVATRWNPETGEIVEQWVFSRGKAGLIDQPPWVRPGMIQRWKRSSAVRFVPSVWRWPELQSKPELQWEQDWMDD